MIWLHTYIGVMIGWLLFAIFFTGTLSYFTPEITRWLMPERGNISQNQTVLIKRSLAYLNEHARTADEWRIYLPSPRSAHWYVQWREGQKSGKATFNNNLNILKDETFTKGGLFFRDFHYTLHLRGYGGRYVAGMAAFALLLGLFTGIYTHRRFFKDFFTLRSQSRQKWTTDFHALSGILTIPFCIMIGTSALFIYSIMYMPYNANANFELGERGVNRQIIPSLPGLNLEHKVQKNKSIAQQKIVEQVVRQWTEPSAIAKITLEAVQYENSRTIVERSKATTVSNRAEHLVFETYTGKPLEGYAEESIPAKIRRVLYGLHQANFAPIALRWLLFGLGVIGCALIATGNIIWVNQRKKSSKQSRFTLKLVEKGNVAVIMGITLASLSFFIANKIIPLELFNRTQWEINAFFIVWAASVTHAFTRVKTLVAWKEQIAMASLLCITIILLECLFNTARIIDSFNNYDIVYLSFFPAFLVAGGGYYWGAHKLGALIGIDNITVPR